MAEDLPPELVEVHAFANTLDVEDGSDAIADAAGLRTWLLGRDLLPEDAAVTDEDVALARRLRDALRDLLLDGGAQSDAAAAEVSRRLPLRVAFADGEPRLEPAGEGVQAALARIVAGIPLAVANGTWERLKLCGADDCQWVFYDRSKNRSRRWCSMAVCGNREKTRTYRSQHRG